MYVLGHVAKLFVYSLHKLSRTFVALWESPDGTLRWDVAETFSGQHAVEQGNGCSGGFC